MGLRQGSGVPVRYVTKTWSVFLLNKKHIYSYLKCIVYDKSLKPPTIILNNPVFPLSSKVSSLGLLPFEDVWTHSPNDRNHVPDDTESPKSKLETRIVKTDARSNK